MKVTFDRPVKYRKMKYAPGEVFEVDEKDLAGMRKLGATVVGADEPTEEDEQMPSREALEMRCEELGIEVGRKADKTLVKLIKEAEAALEE